MTTAFSNAVQANILNWFSGVNMPTAPSSLLLGLLTVAPNADGTQVIEPTNGYARQVVTLGAIVVNTDGSSTAPNTNSLVFGPATADWPQVSYAGLFDQSGNLLAYGPLPAARVAPNGDTISFGAGAIQLPVK